MSRPSQPLDQLLSAVSRALEARLHDHGPQPDFEDVLRRAHLLDDRAVTEQMVRRAGQAEPVRPRQTARSEQAGRDPGLDALLAHVRSGIEAQVEQRALRPIPAWVGDRARGPFRRWVWGMAAAAAVLVLAVGVSSWSTHLRDVASPTDNQAQMIRQPPEATGRARSHGLGRRVTEAATGSERMVATAEGTEGSTASSPPPEPSPDMQRPRRTVSTDRRSDARAESVGDLDETLAQLDQDGRAALRAGALGRAEQAFATIVRLGGRHTLVELAFGELFALAHRHGDAGRQRSLWKRYLRRFPTGQFADDARAGLCRSVSGRAAASCWQRYLRDMPRGTFRHEAERALASTADQAPSSADSSTGAR